MTDEPELAATERNDPVQRALQVADAYLDTERTAAARREVEAALGAYPQDPRLHAMLGRVELADERWESAEESFGRALALDPDEAAHHCGVALARIGLGQYPQAEQAVLRALQLEPEYAWAYELYGRVMHHTGHLDKARRLFRKSLELDPESTTAHQQLVLVESEARRDAAAGHHAREGLRSAPDEVHSHAVDAARLLRSGHPYRARSAAREALRIDAGNQDLVELYLEADRCCRWVYLPMYYWSLAVGRVPGGPIGVWIGFVALYGVKWALGVDHVAFDLLALAYIVLVLYTWIAGPLVHVWLRLRPPQ